MEDDIKQNSEIVFNIEDKLSTLHGSFNELWRFL